MQIVAGLSLRNLQPRVWDQTSPFFLHQLTGIMFSYADFHKAPTKRQAVLHEGWRTYFRIPDQMAIYLDNGAFACRDLKQPSYLQDYIDFVEQTQPDWKPIPRDYIPLPSMSAWKKQRCYLQTMQVNRDFAPHGYVPVIHVGSHLRKYIKRLQQERLLATQPQLALGGIVPNLLRQPKALSYGNMLESLRHVRETCSQQQIHVFGIGGTATLHLAALLGFDSVDSSGWRNRAARGMVQLPGSGERMVVELGNWRGRQPNADEWQQLRDCSCPACQHFGLVGLQASKLHGFCCRATHNLWILLEENDWLTNQLANGTYLQYYQERINNSIYKPLLQTLLQRQPLLGGIASN